MSKDQLTILLAAPRGFCAGVDRAIQIVEQALEKYGAPVYVRHQIVHNRNVVERLESLGAIFVKELDEVPDGAIVIFSAHGVPKAVPKEAARRELVHVDATCPLVSKVHRGVEGQYKRGRTILLIGHEGHPEVVGTMGQLPEGAVILVETVEDVAKLSVDDPSKLAFSTQTTLSVADTADIVEALKTRFPDIEGPRGEDICYATTNRQEAISAIGKRSDFVYVVGSKNSSNSNRLVEVAKDAGCPDAALIDEAAQIDLRDLDGVAVMGLSAGASAPEHLVQGVIAHLEQYREVSVEEVTTATETVVFRPPRVAALQAS